MSGEVHLSAAQGALLLGLVLVALLHAKSRMGGHLGASLWAGCAVVWGVFGFAEREQGLAFLGVQTPKWLYFVVLGALAVVNAALVLRALRRGRRLPHGAAAPADTGLGPGASSASRAAGASS